MEWALLLPMPLLSWWATTVLSRTSASEVSWPLQWLTTMDSPLFSHQCVHTRGSHLPFSNTQMWSGNKTTLFALGFHTTIQASRLHWFSICDICHAGNGFTDKAAEPMCEVIKVCLLDIYPCMPGAVRVQALALHTISDQKLDSGKTWEQVATVLSTVTCNDIS